MAATPKKPQVIKLDYFVDKEVYDEFVRICVKTSYSPKVVLERMMRKFNEGQIHI
jgi:hypothetical protein